MQYSRRGFVGAAVLSVGLLVGCGGGGNSDGGGAVASGSGRFVVRDVTPTDLLKPISAGPVLGFQVHDVSSRGVVAASVYTQVPNPGTLEQNSYPVVIDVNRKTVTRLRGEGAGTTLERGTPTAISAQGDVYGTFQQTSGEVATRYNFLYTQATGQTTVRPFDVAVPDSVSNAGEFLVPRRGSSSLPEGYTSAVANYASPEAGQRLVSSPVNGLTAVTSQINADGVVVGMLARGNNFDPWDPQNLFVWKDGVVTVLPAPDASLGASPLLIGDDGTVLPAPGENLRTYPLWIGDDGLVVGRFSEISGTLRLVTWKNEAATVLPALPVAAVSTSVLGSRANGDLLVSAQSYTPSGAERFSSTYLLWQQSRGAWLDLTADLQNSGRPVVPVALLEDGRLLCTGYSKLFTFTPR